MARYCSSLARSRSSPRLRSVMSCPICSTCGRPPVWIGSRRASTTIRPAVLARAAHLDPDLLAPKGARVHRQPLLLVARAAEGEPREADHLRARKAAHRLPRRIDVDDAEFGVAQHHGLVAGVEDRPIVPPRSPAGAPPPACVRSRPARSGSTCGRPPIWIGSRRVCRPGTPCRSCSCPTPRPGSARPPARGRAARGVVCWGWLELLKVSRARPMTSPRW